MDFPNPPLCQPYQSCIAPQFTFSTTEIVSILLYLKTTASIGNSFKKFGASVGWITSNFDWIFKVKPSPTTGLFGEIVDVDFAAFETFFGSKIIPVVASVMTMAGGKSLIINPDVAACEIVIFLEAEKLIYMIDMAGIMEDPENSFSLVKRMDVEGLREDGKISGRMLIKVECALKAFDDENGYELEYIYGNYLEKLCVAKREIMKIGSGGYDDEKVGLKELFECGGSGTFRVVHRNLNANSGSPRFL